MTIKGYVNAACGTGAYRILQKLHEGGFADPAGTKELVLKNLTAEGYIKIASKGKLGLVVELTPRTFSALGVPLP